MEKSLPFSNSLEAVPYDDRPDIRPAELTNGLDYEASHLNKELSPVDPIEFTPELQKQFADHVEYVRERGDALNVPSYRNSMLGLKPGIAVALLEPPLIDTSPGAAAFITGAVIGGGTAVTWALKSYAKNKHTFKAMSPKTQQALGEQYELFTIPAVDDEPPSIAMRYYGRLDDKKMPPKPIRTLEEVMADIEAEPRLSTLQHIQRMALLAKDNGISHIVIGEGLTEHVIPGLHTVPMRHILNIKEMKTDKGYFKDGVTVKTPDFWLERTDEKQRLEVTQELDGLVDKLRLINPDHTLVTTHDKYGPYPEDQRKRLLHAAQRDIDREHSQTVVRPLSKREVSLGADPRPIKEHHSASYDNGGVTWSFNGRVAESVPLAELIKLTPSEMQELAENPDIDPKKATTLLTALIIEKLQGEEAKVDIPTVTEVDKDVTTLLPHTDPIGPVIETLMTRGSWDRPDYIYSDPMKKTLRTKTANGLFIAGIVGGAVSLGIAGVEAEYHSAVANAKLALEHEGKPTTDQALDARAYAASVPARIGGELYHAVTDLNTLGFSNKNFTGSEALPPSLGAEGGPIGNIDMNTPPEVEWTVIHNSGIDITNGYWAVGTSSQAELSSEGVTWTPFNELKDDKPNVQLLATMLYPYNEPSLIVQRTLKQSDLVTGAGYFKVPVLEGTRPVAAEIDGKQTGLATMADGTYGLSVPAGMESIEGKELKYTLARPADDDPTDADPKAHATQVLQAKVGDTIITDGESIRGAWEAVIPGFIMMSSDEQQAVMKTYIEDNFDYSLRPFPDGYDQNATDLGVYAQRMIALKKGMCASVNSLIALESMGTDENLAIAHGFRTGQGGLLTSRSTHAWNVDTNGNIIDDTPGHVTAEDAAWFSAPALPAGASITEAAAAEQPPAPKPLWPIGALAGVLAAGGIGIAKRKKAQAAWNNHQIAKAVRTHEALLQSDPQLLKGAGLVLDAVLYDPKQDVRAALERGRTYGSDEPGHAVMHPIIPTDLLVDKLLRQTEGDTDSKEDVVSKTVTAIVKDEAQAADPRTKQELHAIDKTLRRAQYVTNHSKQPTKSPKLQVTIE